MTDTATMPDEFEGQGVHFTNRCYKCRYQRHLEDGSDYSRCVAPDEINPPRALRISFDEVGIDNGWADWPMRFNPGWLRFCDAIEEDGL